MKKINIILVLVLLIVMIAGTGIVSAENLNGTIGGSEWNTTNYYPTGAAPSSGNRINYIIFTDFEKTSGFISLINWANINVFEFWTTKGGGTHELNATAGAQTSVTFRIGNGTQNASFYPVYTDGPIIGTGTIGYQRLFNTAVPPVEQVNGYVYVYANTWNDTLVAEYPGQRFVYLEYDYSKLFNISYQQIAATSTPTGTGSFSKAPAGGGNAGGLYTQNKAATAYGYYNVDKPSGLGIQGTVNKTNGAAGVILYPSRVFISDILHNTISSESLQSINPITINVPNSQIYISLLTANDVWYNSSLLFSGISPEFTGTHNITFHVTNQQGVNIYNAKVYFAPIVQVGQVASDIAVIGYTNASGMVTFTNQSASSQAWSAVQATGYDDAVQTFSFSSDMLKEIQMHSPSVDLAVDIRDSATGYYLENFQFGIKNTTSGTWRNSTQESGGLFVDSTGANYEYPLSINETVIIAASKPGYLSNWKSVTIPSTLTYNTYVATLYLINLNATAPSSGNFTAVVAVSNRKYGSVIQGASVAITALGRAGTSSTSGAVTFRNVPVGTYTMTASAAGYNPTSTEITGTDQETVLKSIALVPSGCSLTEGGAVICGNETSPIGSTTGNQSANEKAAGGVTAFLDNIVGIGEMILLLVGFWFGKKIFFS